jgi:hypothetical protein
LLNNKIELAFHKLTHKNYAVVQFFLTTEIHGAWKACSSLDHQEIPHISHPRRTLSKLEKYSFSGERKTHWLGRCNCI